MNSLVSNLKLLAQECSGNYKFSGQAYMTRGFISEFEEAAAGIAIAAIKKIVLERVCNEEGADYLQAFDYNDIRFWIIDDISHISILLPKNIKFY